MTNEMDAYVARLQEIMASESPPLQALRDLRIVIRSMSKLVFSQPGSCTCSFHMSMRMPDPDCQIQHSDEGDKMSDGADPYERYLNYQAKVGRLRVELEEAEWDLEEAKVDYEFHRQRAIDSLRASKAVDS